MMIGEENGEAEENIEKRVRLARTHAHTYSNIVCVGAQRQERTASSGEASKETERLTENTRTQNLMLFV